MREKYKGHEDAPRSNLCRYLQGLYIATELHRGIITVEKEEMEGNQKELVSRLSFEIVKEVAPDELDLFDDFKEEFFSNPDAFLEKDPPKKEKMLGFGEEVVGQFITAGVLPIIWGAVAYIGIAAFKETIGKKVEQAMKDKVAIEKEAPTPNRIKEIKEYVIKNALIHGVDEEVANIIADSLIGKFKQMEVI